MEEEEACSRERGKEVPLRGILAIWLGGETMGGWGQRECGGRGFMMETVQGLPGWKNVSRGTGFVLGQEVSSKEFGW